MEKETKQQRLLKKYKDHKIKVFQIPAPIEKEEQLKRYGARLRKQHYKENPHLQPPDNRFI